MNSKNKVTVKIMGQEYAIKSDETREYMQRIANLVDDRMSEISGSNKSLSTSMVSVLTALTLADDYIKASDRLGDAVRLHDNPALEVKMLRDDLGALQVSYHEKIAECESLTAEFEKLQVANREYESGITALREKYAEVSGRMAAAEGDGRVSGELLKAKDVEIDDLMEYIESLELDKQILKEQLKLKEAEVASAKEASSASVAESAPEESESFPSDSVQEAGDPSGSDEAGEAHEAYEEPKITGLGLSRSIID